MKPGPRRSVSQVDIVDAAFEILEQKGFAAVSVRGVAAALGLTPTAIYTYFPSKNALLRAMVDELLSSLDLAAASDPAVAWRQRVHALAAALRARLAEHTGAMVLVTSGPLDGPHALSLNEALIAGFMGERMPLDDAARAAHAVLAHVLGVAALDAAERAGDVEASAGRTSSGALWSDAASHPLTEATAHLVAGSAGGAGAVSASDDGRADSAFAWGLDRLLDGVLASVAEPVTAGA
ncbi:TetR/AcrR family transcriptional regulator [Agromyces badenianii]|uniref:TetR/AcrR family transcriptional regulator n=1 Tax=Agromyces badenianii TaxID=2080742 RepID=UPI000D59B2CF|nr:TetR/AcrR family transcriptional regulator [Agromyces badenianii]PWC05704.1 TetR/AcrR family transcriptional regulator [Agromyces badenianii]